MDVLFCDSSPPRPRRKGWITDLVRRGPDKTTDRVEEPPVLPMHQEHLLGAEEQMVYDQPEPEVEERPVGLLVQEERHETGVLAGLVRRRATRHVVEQFSDAGRDVEES